MRIRKFSPKLLPRSRLSRRLRGNRAVSAMEYALLLGVVGAGIVGVLATFGDTLGTEFKRLTDKFTAETKKVGT